VLNGLSRYIVYDLFKLPQGSKLAAALDFFLYDAVKILILLTGIIFAISFIRSFFPSEKTGMILSHKTDLIGDPAAVIPIVYALTTKGLSSGTSLAFMMQV
jgi:uncharacterized protein